ncbi:MAG: amidohydrolase family protein [Gemmataceae bacterium]|nr:amidohydrolase family protein [Gemmataceae bacterium]MDW8266428.1 amidohydrolase family protein [Gemmataceae bacterium]
MHPLIGRRRALRQLAGALAAAAVGSAAARERPPLIIDTHQHLWDLSKQKLPWLDRAPDLLRKTYHLAEYKDATRGLNVQAVYMEVDVDPVELAAEAESVLALCRSAKGPTVGAVIGGRPESPGFGDYLRRFKDAPELKGVRRVLHGPQTPAGFCLQDQFVDGVRLLGKLGLSFDLCMRPTELADALRLAERCPETRFVLDHCGNPDLRAFRAGGTATPPMHTADAWKSAIDRLARRPNVICKISGIVAQLPTGGDAALLAPVVNHCLDSFGPERVVFGSDWPVCLTGATLLAWVDMLTEIIAGRSAEDRARLWSKNAQRFYRLS